MDRATVAKYADMDDMTPKPPTDRRRGSKIDPYAALVDGWLEADRMLPRKQRHTAKRVHDRLRAETEYDGEYTTTPGYVRRWRETNRSGSDGYGELVWAPGVAQIDFGVAKARIAGELVDDHCLVVTFPHSNMRYVTSLPGENAECLCHGPVEVFEHIGGVPPVIVMDNATGAGRRNARGEVTPAAVFDAFLAHHRIDARFCNPYSGWEKGAVENAVGFLRRNLMVPPLEAETHTQLGRIMLDRCDALAASSRHYRRGAAIGDVFGEDRAALMPLTSTTFDPIRWGEALNAWHERWKAFIAERTYAKDDPANPKASGRQWRWTHEELHRCYRRLERMFREDEPFAFLEPGLLAGGPVARTTNLLEGGANSLIKRTLLEHHGLPEGHMRRACEWRCYMKSPAPEPDGLIATAFGQADGERQRDGNDAGREGGYDTGIQANNHDDPTNEPGFYIRKGHVR